MGYNLTELTGEKIQDIIDALQAMAPGLASSSKEGLMAPKPYISGGEIGDASATLRGLMTPQNVKDIAYLLAKPRNALYNGRNLKDVFGTAQAFAAAVYGGDFSKIEDGDYWPLTLSGTIHDYGANEDKTLSNVVLNIEFMVNPYFKYGDSGKIADGVPHLLGCSRDLLPWTLKFRSADSTWQDNTQNNPWLGSALYETLNNPTNGLLKLILNSELGTYIYKGPNNKGMRSLMEEKASGATTPTGWGWKDRGVLFLPTEKEVWGNATFSKGDGAAQGAALQWPIFAGSRRHIVKRLGNGGSRYTWWCESSTEGSAVGICDTHHGGLPDDSTAASTWVGCPVCFLIAANA